MSRKDNMPELPEETKDKVKRVKAKMHVAVGEKSVELDEIRVVNVKGKKE